MVDFDASRINHLGSVMELWREGNGELFGFDPSDINTVVIGYYKSPEEMPLYIESVEYDNLTLLFEEVRGDATMYVYEGFRETTGETYWEIVYVVDAENLDGVYVGDFTAEILSAYGIADVNDLVTCFGNLKIIEQ